MKYLIDISQAKSAFKLYLADTTLNDFDLFGLVKTYLFYHIYNNIVDADEAKIWQVTHSFEYCHINVLQNKMELLAMLDRVLGQKVTHIMDKTLTDYTHEVSISYNDMETIEIEVLPRDYANTNFLVTRLKDMVNAGELQPVRELERMLYDYVNYS